MSSSLLCLESPQELDEGRFTSLSHRPLLMVLVLLCLRSYNPDALSRAGYIPV